MAVVSKLPEVDSISGCCKYAFEILKFLIDEL